jgi:aminopeptidase N
MAGAALEDSSSLMARLRATAKLSAVNDQLGVENLKNALQHDPFFGVRCEAASALRLIHSDDALQALLDSQTQSDARVRLRVMESIGGFYDARAFAAEKAALPNEKNPDIAAAEIKALGKSGRADIRDLLVSYLKSDSYHNTLLNAAMAAIGASLDPFYLPLLIETLKARQSELSVHDLGSGLDAVAALGHDQENKDIARELITSFANDKKQGVQTAAIKALGKLEDPRAIPILETFAGDSEDDPNHRAAAAALEAIRSARKPADDLKELRDSILDLQKENRQLRQDVDALKKQFDAQKGVSAKKKKT